MCMHGIQIAQCKRFSHAEQANAMVPGKLYVTHMFNLNQL